MNLTVSPPHVSPLEDILPSRPLLLMGAGPVPLPHEVARANSVVINHLGETMGRIIERVKSLARYAFQTQSDKIFGVAGPASAAMEMSITNLLWPSRKALVLKLGTFSGRFFDMAQAVGAHVDLIEAKEKELISPEILQKALSQTQYDVVTLVQGETSCGLYNHHLPQLAKLIKDHGALSIVDAVCTLTTMPLDMDDWGLDVVITGGQKGLSSIPGVSLLAFSERAWEVIEKRKTPCPHWCLNALLAIDFWQDHQYHYTAPVPGILALHEALRLIANETLPRRFERHQKSSLALQKAILAMGLDLYIPEENRLNSVVAIETPKGIESLAVRELMMKKFKVEISGAFGLDIMRIGQMGEQCRPENLYRVLYSLGRSLQTLGFKGDVASAMKMLEENVLSLDCEL